MPNLVNVFGIFLLVQFFRTLPIELEEAARIDGASRLSILLHIVGRCRCPPWRRSR